MMGVMAELDMARARAFAERLMRTYSEAMVSMLLALGYRTGLLEAIAAGPATSEALAAGAGLSERYVREWLAGLAAGGIVEYDTSSQRYAMPAEHAVCLTGESFYNLAPLSGVVRLAEALPGIEEAFRTGGGIAEEDFGPESVAGTEDVARRRYDALLVNAYLPRAEGLTERLAQGARVADVGCGRGRCVHLMADAFPASSFVGYDVVADSVARATAEAERQGLANASFEVRDVGALPVDPPFDVVCAFDVVHELADPLGVLRRVRSALAPGGTFFMYDSGASSLVEENLDEPWAPLMYGMSVMRCLTVSLAQGGAGLGAMWGRQHATDLLHQAGFSEVTVRRAPGDPINAIYVCHI